MNDTLNELKKIIRIYDQNRGKHQERINYLKAKIILKNLERLSIILTNVPYIKARLIIYLTTSIPLSHLGSESTIRNNRNILFEQPTHIKRALFLYWKRTPIHHNIRYFEYKTTTLKETYIKEEDEIKRYLPLDEALLLLKKIINRYNDERGEMEERLNYLKARVIYKELSEWVKRDIFVKVRISFTIFLISSMTAKDIFKKLGICSEKRIDIILKELKNEEPLIRYELLRYKK